MRQLVIVALAATAIGAALYVATVQLTPLTTASGSQISALPMRILALGLAPCAGAWYVAWRTEGPDRFKAGMWVGVVVAAGLMVVDVAVVAPQDSGWQPFASPVDLTVAVVLALLVVALPAMLFAALGAAFGAYPGRGDI